MITCKAKGNDKENSNTKFTYHSNVTFKDGIHYWEIICPISCSGIEFGVQNKQTLEQIIGTFRTTTPRTVGVLLDLTKNKLSFFLNGRAQPKRAKVITEGEYYLLVNVKNVDAVLILNPFAQISSENVVLPNSLILSEQERNYLLNSISQKEKECKQNNLEEEKLNDLTAQDEVPDEGSPQKIKLSEEKSEDLTEETISTSPVHEKIG
jgi:hypothetical protein